jgi:hypothetical protein
VLRLMHAEQAKLQHNAAHRSTPDTLRRLASRHLFFDLDAARPLPWLNLAALGLRSGAALSARAGSDREQAIDAAADAVLRQCGVATLRGLRPSQREAWRRMAPLLALLDLGTWRDHERQALLGLARAKGGRSERAFIAAWQAHPRLDAALRRSGRIGT